jgi:type IV secretion system protein VirB11
MNGERTLRHLLAEFQPILDDTRVTEIVCNRPGEIGIERAGQWEWRDIDSLTFGKLDAIGILAGSLMTKRFDPYHPICMTNLPDGQRCTLIRPAACTPGTISLTIRIPSKAVHTVGDDDFTALMAAASMPVRRTATDAKLLDLYHEAKRQPNGPSDYPERAWAPFFSLAVKSRKTIVATGATGSGKTSLLRRLMREIPDTERIVTIEDASEYGKLIQRNHVALFYGSAGISASDAVAASLRMRPDRIAMQELRGGEALAYIRALASGHPGSLTTWHAEDGDPWTPLSIMISETGVKIGDDKLRAMFRQFTDIVVHCRKDVTESGAVFSVPSVWFKAAEDAV